ncbi:MAG: hypothetical protein OQJ89_03470, partial [Kangiellaceae bacterium]|nr:hypothetical protein [Kangiellaceae bacterium]
IRMDQLKAEFQHRTKELGRRLKSDDLDQEEWQQLTNELQLDAQASIESTQQATRSDKIATSYLYAFAIIIAVIAIAATTYRFTESFERARGQLDVIQQLKTDPEYITKLSQKVDGESNQQNLEALYQALRTQVELEPNNINAWRSLAMFNSRVGRSEEAVTAIKQAIKMNPHNIDIQIELAQSYASSKDETELRKANTLLQSILQKHPDHQGALVTLGFNSFNLGLYQLAIDAWQKLLSTREPGSSGASMLEKSIGVAKQRLAELESLHNTEQPGSDDAKDVGGGAKITVRLEIPSTIRSSLDGNEAVFIFAKAVDGPPLPLAVVRTSLDKLDQEFVLSDASAMQPQFRLSKFEKVRVTARISKSGVANASTGDIEGETEVLSAPFTSEVQTVVLDKIR